VNARLLQVASPYIERILKARVYDVAIETPLEEATRLSRRLGNQVLLKREDLQPVFSFKLRGAYNRIAHLSEASARRGVVCASAPTRHCGGDCHAADHPAHQGAGGDRSGRRSGHTRR
jgi:threonine dehydratase